MKYALIPIAVSFSAAAQIILKKSAGYENWTGHWFLFLAISCSLYGVSFFAYMYLLRTLPISRIYPILTILVISIITVYGVLIGEGITVKQVLGIAFGIGSVYLLLT